MTHLSMTNTPVLKKIKENANVSSFEFSPVTEAQVKQVAQRATIAHLSPMCQGQISFQKHINGPWKPEARNQTSELLCLSWLPATLMTI